MDQRYGRVKWGKGNPRQRTSAANWKLPLKWNREAALRGCGDCDPCIGGRRDQCAIDPSPRPRVFCASLADWLDDEVPIEWLADLLKLIHDTPNLDYLLLTKRPENFEPRLEKVDRLLHGPTDLEWARIRTWISNMRHGWNNVTFSAPEVGRENYWLGVSVENQAMADKRIPLLLDIPAKVRFLSVEPMLEKIDLRYAMFTGAESFSANPGIHWSIFGGESGNGARFCNAAWIEDGLKQCREVGISPFVKQLGSNANYNYHDKKGGDIAEWPKDLRVREFP